MTATRSIQRSAGLAALQETPDEKVPLPTAGLRAIANICNQAAGLMRAAAAVSPAKLESVVVGNNAASLPAAGRIHQDHVGQLAALAKALEKDQTKNPEPPKPRGADSHPQKVEAGAAEKPAADHKLVLPQVMPAKPEAKAPSPEKPTIELPEVKILGDAKKPQVIQLDPVVIS